jgi:peroxiredoxin
MVLSFYRGGWCPFCNIYLRGFERARSRLKELGALVVAVSPQLPDISFTTRHQDELTFPVLSDVGNKTARKLGIVSRYQDA